MFPLSVVTAVCIGAVFVKNRMVAELPYAAAHQIVVPVYMLPVVLYPARADSHGMSVFAHKIRPVIELFVFPLPFSGLFDLFRRRIHLASDIVGASLAVDNTFIVDRQRADGFQIIITEIGIGIASRFIPQTPHYYARPVFVSSEQAFYSLQIMLFPFSAIAYGVICRRIKSKKGSMSLKIVFIDHIYPQLITKLEKIRIRRIVGCADSVYIVFLTKFNIPSYFSGTHRISARRQRIMVVYAVKLEFSPVDLKNCSVDLDPFESRPLFYARAGSLYIQIV